MTAGFMKIGTAGAAAGRLSEHGVVNKPGVNKPGVNKPIPAKRESKVYVD